LRLRQNSRLTEVAHIYEVRPHKDKRGVDRISETLPFGRLWYGESNATSNAIGYAAHYNRSHDAVIRVYDAAGNVIETHEHAGDFKKVSFSVLSHVVFDIALSCRLLLSNAKKRTLLCQQTTTLNIRASSAIVPAPHDAADQ
jgi:hypothetical protein